MQFQADLLGVPIVRSEVEDACAYGAFIMNGFARGKWKSFEEAAEHWTREGDWAPQSGNEARVASDYAGWREAVSQLIK